MLGSMEIVEQDWHVRIYEKSDTRLAC